MPLHCKILVLWAKSHRQANDYASNFNQTCRPASERSTQEMQSVWQTTADRDTTMETANR